MELLCADGKLRMKNVDRGDVLLGRMRTYEGKDSAYVRIVTCSRSEPLFCGCYSLWMCFVGSGVAYTKGKELEGRLGDIGFRYRKPERLTKWCTDQCALCTVQFMWNKINRLLCITIFHV